MFLNSLIILFLIIVVIVNVVRIKNKSYIQFSKYWKNLKKYIKELFKNNIFDVEIKTEVLIINSKKKLGFFICLVLILVLYDFKINYILKFAFIEFIIFFISLNILNFVIKQSQFFKLFFGQFYVPLIGTYLAIEFLILELNHRNVSFQTFYIFMTLLVLSLYISISVYYSVDNEKIKLIHLVFCYLNIILVCLIMFSYIGYGFMIYDIKELNLGTNEGSLNVKGPENIISQIAVLISYGVDHLSQGSGIEIKKSNHLRSINSNKIIFSLVSKVFVSTYIALVLTFLGNTLFKENERGG